LTRAAGAKPASPRATATCYSTRPTTAGAETRASSSAASATAARTFRRQNHLEELVGIFEKVLKLVALRAESLRRKLRGHLDACYGGIFRHVANFVDLNTRLTGEGGF
jgi:hypothetical protein